MIVVIPSNRLISLNYLKPLIDDGATFIIVDDTPGTISIDHPSFQVYNWGDRARILGDLDFCIPRKTGACMAFGFYLAWRDAEDDEIIITFGDDCEIVDREFPQKVRAALSNAHRPRISGSSASFNILDAYEGIDDDLFPRGFPYSERGSYRRWEPEQGGADDSAFNVGLWTGAFDVNAVDKINGPQWEYPAARLRHWSVIVPPGPLLCVCSMNMHFRRFLVPAAYQLPMHIPALPHWVVDRYGDIWGGYILRRLMAIGGHNMSVGEPRIQHNKVPSYEHNIWQEHIGHMINDEFIALLDESSADVSPSDYLTMTSQLNEEMRRRTEHTSRMLQPYMAHLTECLGGWTQALREARH